MTKRLIKIELVMLRDYFHIPESRNTVPDVFRCYVLIRTCALHIGITTVIIKICIRCS